MIKLIEKREGYAIKYNGNNEEFIDNVSKLISIDEDDFIHSIEDSNLYEIKGDLQRLYNDSYLIIFKYKSGFWDYLIDDNIDSYELVN